LISTSDLIGVDKFLDLLIGGNLLDGLPLQIRQLTGRKALKETAPPPGGSRAVPETLSVPAASKLRRKTRTESLARALPSG